MSVVRALFCSICRNPFARAEHTQQEYSSTVKKRKMRPVLGIWYTRLCCTAQVFTHSGLQKAEICTETAKQEAGTLGDSVVNLQISFASLI